MKPEYMEAFSGIIHSPEEEWVGYPMIICGFCQEPWPCAFVQSIEAILAASDDPHPGTHASSRAGRHSQ
jgi:hypothetical protein